MPIPTPHDRESENDFMSRCMEFMYSEDSGRSHDQMVAICNDKWSNKGKEESRIESPDPIRGEREVQIQRITSLESIEINAENTGIAAEDLPKVRNIWDNF